MTKTIAQTVKPSRIKKGEPTVTVYCVDGSSFEAPAKGPVLASDYVPDEEVMFSLLDQNYMRIADPDVEVLIDGFTGPELLERSKETQRKYDDARRANSEYYATLPKFFDYDKKGTLKKKHSN